MSNPLYSGSETGKLLSIPSLRPTDTAFAVAIPSLPYGAQPIIDDVSGACVGYIYEGVKNIWHIFDVSGQRVGIEEAPLETPLVDPYDLILIGPAVARRIQYGCPTGGWTRSSFLYIKNNWQDTPSSSQQIAGPIGKPVAIYRNNRQAHGKPWPICANPYSSPGHKTWKTHVRPSKNSRRVPV